MAKRTSLRVPLNRVEGDLEVRVELEDGVVADAWCSGTMFRGIENVLVGRGPMDGLVITPRICGICGTSHLTAAARALDAIAGVTPPAGALRIRNACLAAEHAQSDLRHAFLLFAVDLADPAHRDLALHDEAVRRYQPFRGETVLEVVRWTKKLLEVIAILGGQWPHSSFMVPGGVASTPTSNDFVECRLVVTAYREWYERRILGCRLERWAEVRSRADLDRWLEEPVHRESDLGVFLRLVRELGLDRPGRGHGEFLSFGAFDRADGSGPLVPAGVARGVRPEAFDPALVTEDVASSWYVGSAPRRPSEGETRPYATGDENGRYSWAKAPRYAGRPAETGPLAERVVAGDPLFVELVGEAGPTPFARELARIVRQVELLPALETWLVEAIGNGRCYEPPGSIEEGEACGLTQAARGALGHWVRIEDGRIARYQIITPTAWNASPRDGGGVRGPIEEALVGTAVRDPEHPLELGYVVRSFDPCLVCTVHTVSRGRTLGRVRVGLGP